MVSKIRKEDYEGKEFTIRRGVVVKVVEYISCREAVVEDSLGNRKTVRPRRLRVGDVSWQEFYLPTQYLGQKKTTKWGVTIEVIEVIDKKNLRVKDEDGNTKIISTSRFISNAVSWKEFGIPSAPRSGVKIGNTYVLNCGVLVEVVEYKSSTSVTVRDNRGNYKITSAGQLVTGEVGWDEFLKVVHIGDVKILKCGTTVSVKDLLENDILLLEDSFGNQQTCNKSLFLDNSLYWLCSERRENKGTHYVYIVEYLDEILYIGKGKDNRYMHPNSGTSSVYELNKLHFNGIKVNVTKFKFDLSNEDAADLEKTLIYSLKPKYNTVHNRV